MSLINSNSVLEIQRLKREKKEKERVIAVLKESGNLVVLDHKREFDSRIHNVYIPTREGGEECKVEEVQPVQIDLSVDFLEKVNAQKAELEELKLKKAWLSSDAGQKARYAELKAIYG